MASKRKSSYYFKNNFGCTICRDSHAIRVCKKFKALCPTRRYDHVALKQYCINCLARSHLIENCKVELGCRICFCRHHTMLHGALQLAVHVTDEPDTKDFQQNAFLWTRVFVPTATVRISYDTFESGYCVRALINSSLTVSRISRSCTKKLELPVKKTQGYEFAMFKIQPHNERHNWFHNVIALITDELPKRPYSAPINENPTEEFAEDSIADFDPRSNTLLDIELGAEIYTFIRRDGTINTSLGGVVAEKSALGYLFIGPVEK